MLPTEWMVLDALPMNANGKIDRPRLRQMFSGARTAKVGSRKARLVR
jgi:acyl-coenzyme A synthetase/AMP-(fatty) acid ligase